MQIKMKNVGVFIVLILFSIFLSFFLLESGFIETFENNIRKLTGNALTVEQQNDKPKIDIIINSSGENEVSEDVLVIVGVTDKAKIKKVEYSYDKESWFEIKDLNYEDNKYVARQVFNDNMNEEVFIRAINEYGNTSYYKSTIVNINK